MQSLKFLLPLAILASLALPPLAGSQAGSEASQKAIRAVLDDQQQAWNRGDIPAFMKGYWNSPELTFSSSSGVSRGYQAVLDRYLKTYPDKAAMGHLEFSNLEVRMTGPASALVLGNWYLTRQKQGVNDDKSGVFTLVFAQISGDWRIIHDHTSVAPVPKGN